MRRCTDCHFLAKVQVQTKGNSYTWYWDENERARKYILLDRYIPECHKQVWSMRLDPTIAYAFELEKKRRNCRFFVAYQRGMSFSAATELLDLKDSVRRNRITIIGIVVVGVIAIIGWFI